MVTGVEVPVIRTAVTIFGVRVYSLQDKEHISVERLRIRRRTGSAHQLSLLNSSQHAAWFMYQRFLSSASVCTIKKMKFLVEFVPFLNICYQSSRKKNT